MQRRPKTRNARPNRRGAAIVEFAVVAPLLIVLLLGMIECGRMIMVQQSLTNAAREGARAAIIEGNSASTAISAVDSFLTAVGVRGATIKLAPSNPAALSHGRPVTVSVSVSFEQVSWLPTPFFLANKTLSSSATMRRETPN